MSLIYQILYGFVESSLTKKPFAIEIGFTTDNLGALIVSAANTGATLIKKQKQNPSAKQWLM